MKLVVTLLAATFLCVVPSPLLAQWAPFLDPDTPLTSDGQPNLDAPTPMTADGKPDLTGVWETFNPRRRPATPAVAAEGTGEIPPSGGSVFGNIGINLPNGAPYQPWAAELVKQRMADNSKDNPDAHCLPMGVMQMTSHPYPRKIIQTPKEVVIIYEGSGTTVREVFLDGRTPVEDPQPWWNGYSTGYWDGDTLVVETTGFRDGGWLDVRGSPLTDNGTLIERFHRPSYGTLVVDVTIDDPVAYTEPFTARVNYRLAPEEQLIEFVCLDDDAQHYVGGDGTDGP